MTTPTRAYAPQGTRIEAHRFTFENGLPVVVVERRQLPLVSLRLVVPSGSARDPARKEGLAGFAAELLARGTTLRDADRLHAQMEGLGGRLGADAGSDHAVVDTEVPAENLNGAMNLLAEVVSSPRFAPAEVAAARRRMAAEIKNSLDDPAAVADRAVRELAFACHPYGHPPDGTLRSVGRLGRRDAVAFHRAHFGPANAVLFVVGDAPAKVATELAGKAFGRWKAKVGRVAPLPEPAPIEGVKVLVVDKPGATQVQVRIASRGIAGASPAYHAARVANTVFGGSFTSRLMQALRVEEGLTYGASSSLAMRAAGGAVYLRSFTRTETVARLVKRALAECERARVKGFTAAELERAKNYLAGTFPFDLETNGQVASWLADIEVYGLPPDFVETYLDRIRAVTSESAAAFCDENLPHRNFALVAVGEAKHLVRALAPFGPVEVKKLAQLA